MIYLHGAALIWAAITLIELTLNIEALHCNRIPLNYITITESIIDAAIWPYRLIRG